MRKITFITIVCAFVAVPARADLTSTFDTDADGWNIISSPWDTANGTDYGAVDGTYDITWIAAGGHVDGYVQKFDPDTETFFFNAPAKFRGNLSSYIGQDLEFYLKTDKDTWEDDSVVVLIGDSEVIVSDIAMPGTDWTAYSIPLVYSSFNTFTYPAGVGGTVGEANFHSIMSDLTALRLPGEFGSDVFETTGLDSVRITPVPGAFLLGILGLGVAGVKLRKFA